MAELIARITALLRRPGGALGTTLEASNVRLDTVGRELTIGGTPSAVPKNTSRSLGSMAGKTRRCRNRGFELHQYGRLHQAGGQLRNARSNSRFYVKGHKTSPLGDAELAAVAVV